MILEANNILYPAAALWDARTEFLEGTPFTQRFGYLLKQAQPALRTRMDEELRAHELTTSQYAVLSAVALEPGISNAALSESAFVTAQTMQGIVATLEKRAFLERAPDPNHGRILITHLTATGRETLGDAHNAVVGVETLMLGSVTKNDQNRVTQTLQTCIENLTLNKSVFESTYSIKAFQRTVERRERSMQMNTGE